MQEVSNQITITVIIGTLVMLILVGFIIVFIIAYQQRYFKHKQQLEHMEQNFQKEILNTTIEVQEQTLHYISQEIHDNITQILSFVKLTLALSKNAGEEQKTAKIEESRELIAQAINDLRGLSKSLSYDSIRAKGLVHSIEQDLERLQRSSEIDTSFVIEGEPYNLGEQRELVLFRIFQESINNALKHAGAHHIKILLNYSEQMFNLTIQDDGKGFSAEVLDSQSGLGLKNMKNRAALIGAVADICSSPEKGCCIKVTIDPFVQQEHVDRAYSDSIG